MAVPFVSRVRKNPRDLGAEGRYYPAAAYISEVGIDQLASEISESTTLTPTEVIGVIRSLLATVPKYMLLGYKVRLEKFGIFKLGLKTAAACKGYEKAAEVSANDIDSVKVLFTPDVMVNEKLKKPEYVKLDAKYTKSSESTDGSGEETLTE